MFPSGVGPPPAKLSNLLVKLAKWAEARGGKDSWTQTATSQLREELVSLKGVGLATADEILLFALDRPVFPVDRAAYRILARHGWIDASMDYDEVRELMTGVVGDAPSDLTSVLGLGSERSSERVKLLSRHFRRDVRALPIAAVFAGRRSPRGRVMIGPLGATCPTARADRVSLGNRSD